MEENTQITKKGTNKKALIALGVLFVGLMVSTIPLLAFVFFAISVKLSMDAKKEIKISGEKGLLLAKVVEVISAILTALGLFAFLSSLLVGLSGNS